MKAILLVSTLFEIFSGKADPRQVYLGPDFSRYALYQNDEDARSVWRLGGEIGVANLIPQIGVSAHGSVLRYLVDQITYEYIPLSVNGEFNLVPFINKSGIGLYLRTGFGLFLWKGLSGDQVVILPTGEKMEEKDFGFVGGLSLRIKPFTYLGVEIATRYNYIASANIYKYGYFDKDDKIWENGVSLKLFLP